MQIVLFGAGSTGRGHLNTLLWEAGQRQVTLIDKNSALVEALRQKGSYRVRLLGHHERTLTIGGFAVLDRREDAAIIDAICTADLVLTAVIAENLENVAQVIAAAIAERRRRGIGKALNIVACENLDRASCHLKRHAYARLSPTDAAWADANVGFPDAMISRVVPLVKDDPLAMIAEDHNEWVVRRRDFLGPDPGLPCLTLIDDLEAYLERKLWIHNGGHATVAYAGLLRGHTYIHEAVADPVVGELALAVLGELAATITSKHGMPANEVRDYAMGLVGRGQIVEMRDELLRVVRDPIRKLGLNDRLLAPAIYAELHGLPNGAIVRSVVNVLAYHRATDAESVRMQRIIAEQGLRSFLDDTLGLRPHPGLVAKILAAHQAAGLQRTAAST